jgi:hypothetical protein
MIAGIRHEEHHDQPMRGDRHVPQVQLLVEAGVVHAQKGRDAAQILDARLRQFGASAPKWRPLISPP